MSEYTKLSQKLGLNADAPDEDVANMTETQQKAAGAKAICVILHKLREMKSKTDAGDEKICKDSIRAEIKVMRTFVKEEAAWGKDVHKLVNSALTGKLPVIA